MLDLFQLPTLLYMNSPTWQTLLSADVKTRPAADITSVQISYCKWQTHKVWKQC